MTSIAICVNLFGSFQRQDLCIASLLKLRDKHPNVKLYNLQIPGTEFTEHPEFETVKTKGCTAKNWVEDAESEMPMVADFFDTACSIGADYFVFLNSDIIVNSKIIKLIEENNYDTISMSRLAIHPIDNIETKDISHSHYQIAGFDVWAVKSEWWAENSLRFPDYVYAVSAWDVDYAARFMVLGNSHFDTNFPPGCFHVIHQEKSHDDTPERRHNVDLFFNKNKPLCDAWHKYLFEVLDRRGRLCPNYTKTAEGEAEIIKTIFKNEDLYTACSNWS